ncbi:MerC domain-containing protein [Erythrobacter sp. YT30]|uniref:MerC domain-containing protein n=1 Tax=Erythrobacter sp. YT30 TaxID=1735012 RepID=UPI0009EC843B|nr:MerC domain-containing protein [Erythrobacter sp. YT30]
MQSTVNTDRAAAAFSIICIAHCLALPVLAFALPVAGTLAEVEAIHITFAILAIVTSASIPLRSADGRTAMFLIPASLGIGLITSALFADALGLSETAMTVSGALLLSFAHLRRLRAQHTVAD